jgi:hypothetical protein
MNFLGESYHGIINGEASEAYEEYGNEFEVLSLM